jgi:putative tryptophan/tyrosine transport system substrate-binding protein
MRRRTFLALAASAAALPTRGLSQPSGGALSGAKRLGVLTPIKEEPVFYKYRATALLEGFGALGWKAGGNLSIDWRHSHGDGGLLERHADELVALAPDAILAVGTPCVEALRRRTRRIPIVFILVTDPVGQGFVENLSRPGGNLTGFSDFDLAMGAKWLEMLTEIAPRIATVGALYNPASAPFAESMLRVIGEAAVARGVTMRPAPVDDETDLETAVAGIAREARSGLLVLPDVFTILNRSVLIDSVARARLPAVYWNRAFVTDGGLMSYGADINDIYRRSADYIDRIFKGAEPGGLPVQYPTKFELVVNLKNAMALGLQVPPTLLAAADEVIE